MFKVSIRLLALALTLLVPLTLFSFSMPQSLCAEEVCKSFDVKKGLIEAISLPDSCTTSESEDGSRKHFRKLRTSLSECRLEIDICEPKTVPQQLLEKLTDLLRDDSLSDLQTLQIRDLPSFPISSDGAGGGELSGNSFEVSGKRLLLVERQGTRKGPCEFLPNGSSRIPLLRYVRGVVYVVARTQMQAIEFEADVMGDSSACLKTIRTAIESIVWKK